ncbi:MAG TPA: hypothetical protein VHC45_05190 [Gaiellaceae bacterium]|nr:hypothetical protein [Gaiellaceae bacterium]
MTAPAETVRPADIPRPPVWEAGMGVLILVVIAVVYLAAHIPGTPNLIPAYILLVAASALVLFQGLMIGSIDRFSRSSFHQVGGWALLAYVVIGGMIEYVFLRNHTRGQELGLLTWGLALFVLEVPIILAFTVARYQQPD